MFEVWKTAGVHRGSSVLITVENLPAEIEKSARRERALDPSAEGHTGSISCSRQVPLEESDPWRR